MTKVYTLTLLILIFIILAGCLSNQDIPFNDSDIKFKLLDSQEDRGSKSYDIQITNTGELEISHINLYLHFPIILENGSKSNPFKIEGQTDQNEPIHLKTGDSIKYRIFAPIKEVYGESNLLDYEHPSIELNGFFTHGDKEIPFGMRGGLSVFLRDR